MNAPTDQDQYDAIVRWRDRLQPIRDEFFNDLTLPESSVLRRIVLEHLTGITNHLSASAAWREREMEAKR